MKNRTLIVTAHPDDETLWFSSITMRKECDLVCVTCGSNSRESVIRETELRQAAHILNIKNLYILKYNDIFRQRLDVAKLKNDLEKLKLNSYREVYTHGPFGDTNEHFHHQDVCYAVNMVFESVKCTAWNIYPDEVNTLTSAEYALKKSIMGTIYFREYKKLKSTYELSSIEKFVSLSRDSIEIFYWAIANFGDRHEVLGKKFRNIWGYDLSPYEIERHGAIVKLASSVKPRKIIEIGSGEGYLTDKLATISTKISCVEKAPIYVSTLREKGYTVIKSFDSSKFDLVVIASVLEYIDNPEDFLRSIKSKYIIVETIKSEYLKKVVSILKKKYSLIKKISVLPRWEKMYHGNKTEKMEVYRLGADVYLFGPHE